MPSDKERPEPEKDANGYRIITEKYACELCEYNGGYLYPHLNKNCYLHFSGFHKIENLDMGYYFVKSSKNTDTVCALTNAKPNAIYLVY